MSYSARNYRHRNPKTGDDQKTTTPFFNSPKGSSIQKKKKQASFQTKLAIGKSDDHFEKEADNVASQVAARNQGATPVLQQKEIGKVQRLATSKEDEKLSTHDARMEKDKEEPLKPVQMKQGAGNMKEKEKDKKPVRKAEDPEKKKKTGGGQIQKKPEMMASPGLSAEIEKQSGKGSCLPAKTLAEMNKSFGMDFSEVRIHHDADAAKLCQELNAQAFTQGRDIYFNEGKFNPDTTEGKMLLAHELTHVAQQANSDQHAV